MQSVYKYFEKFYGLFLIAILFLGMETMADLYQPLLISKLVDDGIANMDMAKVLYYGKLMLLATGVGLTGALMRNLISTHISFKFAKELRAGLFEKLMSLSMLQVESIESGSLMTRLTSDVNMIQQFVNGTMRILLKAPFLAVGSFIMVMNLDPRFRHVYYVLTPIIVVITVINIKLGFPLYSKVQKVLDQLNQKTMEFLGGIRAVRAFDRFDLEMESFSHISGEFKNVTTKTMRVMAIFGPMIMFIIDMSVVYVIYVGRFWVQSGDIGVGQIIAFINYMTQFLFAMSIISRVFTVFARAKSSVIRINEIFNLSTSQELEALESSVHRLQGSIQFDKVCFRYGNGAETLSDFTFSIKKGESIGILGSTGSGKTTLIHLVNRIMKPTSGTIYIDHTPLESLSKKELSDIMGYVPQKASIFSGSVIENLSWGKRGLEEEGYKKALEEACALDFVEAMPRQMATQIGRNGVNISGGQKQRLSIARALVHAPKILILDDSTSAVDVITEKSIKEKLKGYSEMTVLLIAQKVSSVKDMDRIMILENGHMTALDTHERLLKTSSLYRNLYAAETGTEVIADGNSKQI